MPMLLEDYLQKITSDYGLNLNNFCIYQGKLEEVLFSQPVSIGDSFMQAQENKLMQMFEELSGSIAFKPQTDDFKFKLANCDEAIKKESETLQSLRLEKVKQKGLQEFAEQMNDCLRD
jgi:chromosome segregation ATPase